MSEELFESKESLKLGPPMDEADATKVVDRSGMVMSGASIMAIFSSPFFVRRRMRTEVKKRALRFP
ncbi:MAG TPA: hypothetical protein VM912_10925 [Terriglobales bacterium]|nr:hypothetical protein [Terriglobales bacterium]